VREGVEGVSVAHFGVLGRPGRRGRRRGVVAALCLSSEVLGGAGRKTTAGELGWAEAR